MAIIRNIEIDGRQVPFKASAAIPRIYRLRFGRDIYADIGKLSESVEENDPAQSRLSGEMLGVFEDVAYTMAKYADPDIPETVEDWLDGFSVFSIYLILPEIVKLWNLNTATLAESKKKQDAQSAQ